MLGRTPYGAVQTFLGLLQQAISCVTRDVISIRGGVSPTSDSRPLALGDVEPVRLAGDARVALSVLLLYQTVEAREQHRSWTVRTIAYFYTLHDASGHEIIAYHWHPTGSSPITMPHLHLGAGARVGRGEVAEAHLPTGVIALQDVLRLAIIDFGVRPLRRDWRAILDSTQAELAE